MYCKACGHRDSGRSDTCPRCGAKVLTAIELTPQARPKVRWGVVAGTLAIAAAAFVLFPYYFLRTELERIGPTDRLRFLRALERSEYRRVGQKEFRIDGEELIVVWDLRWKTLPEGKQRDVVRIVGRAWSTVGGDRTHFRLEGEDTDRATFTDGDVHIVEEKTGQ